MPVVAAHLTCFTHLPHSLTLIWSFHMLLEITIYLCALLICSSSIISMSKYSGTHTTRVSHSFCWNAPLLPMQVPPPPQPPLPNNVDDDLPALFIPNVPYISSVCGRYELLNMSTTVFTNIARIANVVQVTLWLSVNYLNRCLCSHCSHCSQCLLVSTSVY